MSHFRTVSWKTPTACKTSDVSAVFFFFPFVSSTHSQSSIVTSICPSRLFPLMSCESVLLLNVDWHACAQHHMKRQRQWVQAKQTSEMEKIMHCVVLWFSGGRAVRAWERSTQPEQCVSALGLVPGFDSQ